MIKVRLSSDLRKLDQLERELPRRVEASVKEAAEALKADIRSSWSSTSPSRPGNPPAMDTGNLDSAIFVDTAGRDASGRFASDADAVRAFVRIDTTQGSSYHGRGAYEGYLEDGTPRMAARPFVQPAVERLEGVYSQFFTEIFK